MTIITDKKIAVKVTGYFAVNSNWSTDRSSCARTVFMGDGPAAADAEAKDGQIN